MHVMYKGMSYRKNLDGRHFIHLILKIHVTFKSFFFRVYSGKFHEEKRLDSIQSDKRTGTG